MPSASTHPEVSRQHRARAAVPRRALRRRGARLRVAVAALVRSRSSAAPRPRWRWCWPSSWAASPSAAPSWRAARSLIRCGPTRGSSCAIGVAALAHAAPAARAALGLRRARGATRPHGRPSSTRGSRLLAALVLLPATILLGATVPLAVEFLSRAGAEVHAGFGRLYLLNTLGGALGVALAPFVLVPALGVQATLVVAAAASLFVGGVALRLSREAGPVAPASAGLPDASDARQRATLPAGPALGLALAFASGAATFGVEVLWTRSLRARDRLVGLRLQPDAAGGAARHRPRLGVYGALARAHPPPGAADGLLFVLAGVGGRSPDSGRSAGCRSSRSLALELLPVSFAAPPARVPRAVPARRCCRSPVVLGLTFPLLLHLSAGAQEGPQQRGRPALRVEHGRRHRGCARRRPRARATPRPAAALPRVRRAAGRGRRLGTRRRRAPRRARWARPRAPRSSRRRSALVAALDALGPRADAPRASTATGSSGATGSTGRDASARGCASSARCSSTARAAEAVVAVSEPTGGAPPLPVGEREDRRGQRRPRTSSRRSSSRTCRCCCTRARGACS